MTSLPLSYYFRQGKLRREGNYDPDDDNNASDDFGVRFGAHLANNIDRYFVDRPVSEKTREIAKKVLDYIEEFQKKMDLSHIILFADDVAASNETPLVGGCRCKGGSSFEYRRNAAAPVAPPAAAAARLESFKLSV